MRASSKQVFNSRDVPPSTLAKASSSLKRAASLALAGLGLLSATIPNGHAAVNLDQLLTFDTLPAVSDFATVSIAGAGGDIITVADLDASVQINAVVSSFINPLSSATSDPINANALARWSGPGHYIGTRPTGVGYVMMLGHLVNSTAQSVNTLIIRYDLANPNPAPNVEDPGLNGQRVFYSLTGAANSWTLIPELTTATPGSLSATLSLGAWPSGSSLYLLWVDDNGSGGTDSGFQIDNFFADSGTVIDTTPPTLVSGDVDPLDDTLVTVIASELLCQDFATCFSDPSSAGWHIRLKSDPSQELGASVVLPINGTVVTLRSSLPREVGLDYIVTVDAQTLSDLHGNLNQAELSVDLNPALAFQQGLHGYGGTHDTELRGAAPDTVQVSNPFVTVDQEDAGGISYGLLRFEGVFGSDQGQVPLGAQILSANLILVHSAANAAGTPVELHRLLVPFDEATATYNNFGTQPGLQADGTEAATTIDTTIVSAGLATPFTLKIDVTPTVQDWANGDPNFGWGFVPTGTDGYRWDTSESANPPLLEIRYKVLPCVAAPAITGQPVPVNVTEGSPFSLSATVSACNPAFQWVKDGVDVPGATESIYNAVAVAGTGGSAGTYRLRVTNPNGTALSSPVVVTVVNDTTRPKLIGAEGSLSGTTITLTFSKAMKAGPAESTGNYTLTPSVPVAAAVLGNNGTVVTLTTGQRTIGTYSLRIANLTDDRLLSNPLDPSPTIVPLTTVTLVLGYGAGTWKFETNSQDATLTSGTKWYAPGFDDNSWQSGQAFFGFETGAAVINALPPPKIVTTLPPNSDPNFPDAAVTSYFRRPITLPTLPSGGYYVMCHYIDDGAVFYLDGVELARYNMPADLNPVLFTNRATAAIEAFLNCFLFTAPSGNHSLAIEVHQGGVTTSDVVFGAEIVAVAAPPRLSARAEAGGVRISWPGDSAWQLGAAPAVTGPYNPVAANAFGTFLIPSGSTTNMEFFDLRYRDPQ